MTKGRLEAFSDGVIAILITIMVLELKIPHGDSLEALKPLAPEFCAYVLSFVFLGIYWNNHHHTLHATTKVTGGVLWANLHLLFWLSLIPVTTGWLGESELATWPTAIYGLDMLMSAIAYTILVVTIIRAEGPESVIAKAIGADFKGKVSLVLYVASIGLAFVQTWISAALFVTVSLIWLVPDRRIERHLHPAA